MRVAKLELSEADFMRQVTDLAEIYGWQWAHFRPAQTTKGWRTPVSGPMGKGYPDLILAHPYRRRLMFVELKREGAKLRPEQDQVLEILRLSGAEAYAWRPSDIDDIVRELG